MFLVPVAVVVCLLLLLLLLLVLLLFVVQAISNNLKKPKVDLFAKCLTSPQITIPSFKCSFSNVRQN